MALLLTRRHRRGNKLYLSDFVIVELSDNQFGVFGYDAETGAIHESKMIAQARTMRHAYRKAKMLQAGFDYCQQKMLSSIVE